MKERYFTDETIQIRSREILSEFEHLNKRSQLYFDPFKAGLLILDMQDYFLDQRSHAYIPSVVAIIPGLLKLIAAFQKHKRPLVFTRHVNTPEDANMMSLWWQEVVHAEDELSRVNPQFQFDDAFYLNKTQYDAFYGTELEQILRENQVQQLIITGVMTHLCCETTARSAFMRGFTVFFPVDGTATYSLAHHKASLLNLTHGFVIPSLVSDLVELKE